MRASWGLPLTLLGLIGCSLTPPVLPGARFSLDDGSAIVEVVTGTAYRLQYLLGDRWTRLRVVVEDGQGGTWNGEAVAEGAPDGGTRAVVDVPGLPVGGPYVVSVTLLDQDGRVLTSAAQHGIALHSGPNAIRFERPLLPRREVVTPPTGAQEAYVTSLTPFGPAGTLADPQAVAADARGRYFVLDQGTLRAIVPDNEGRLSSHTIAGKATGSGGGFMDGPGDRARFQSPLGLAVGPDGTLFVADTGNNAVRAVRVDDQLRATVSTVGAPGTFDGPRAITVDGHGALFVAEGAGNRIRRVEAEPAGGYRISEVAGDGSAGLQDGLAGAAKFNRIVGLALDGADRLLVADAGNRRIRLVSLSDRTVSTIAGGGAGVDQDGVGTAASFNSLQGICRTPTGEVLLLSRRLRKLAWLPDGRAEISTIAGGGAVRDRDCSASEADFSVGSGIGIGAMGEPLVLTRTALLQAPVGGAQGLVTRIFGSYSANGGVAFDGPNDYRSDIVPNDFALDEERNLFVSTQRERKIFKFAPGAAFPELVAGTGLPDPVDGPAPSAGFGSTQGMAFDPESHALLIADTTSQTIRRLTLGTGASVSTFAGLVDQGGHTDGPLAVATFRHPTVVVRGPGGDVFVSDALNRAIRKIADAGAGMTVSTVAGAATRPSYADGPAATAGFGGAVSLDFVGEDRMVIADPTNACIRQLVFAADGSASISTLTGGNGIGVADGPLGIARFTRPWQVVHDDANGDLYLLDDCRVRRIHAGTEGGMVVTTIAGGDEGYADGPGKAARFGRLASMIMHPDGYLLVADEDNHLIRKITLPWR